MLDDAVAAYLDAVVNERAFDEPLLAVIRSQGFTDVHLVHGQREFGKDVIGRRDGEQWAWQSKIGNIGQSQWRDLVGQLDELRLVNLGHGAFDTTLPRKPVLVTTGRLTGNAPELYRDYNDRADVRGEPKLELWTRDHLLGLLSGNPDAMLRGSMDGQLLAVLGSVDAQTATIAGLELFSRRWTAWEPDRLAGLGVIEAALVCDRLRTADRLDLACHLALCLVRGAWASRTENLAAAGAADAAGALFETYTQILVGECDDRLLSANGLVAYSGPAAWVTYPLRCVRTAEMLALLALRLEARDAERAEELRKWLTTFAAAQPGLARPLGDQYAVSMIPIVIALARESSESAKDLLRRCAIWLCDAYEPGQLGLAGVDVEPKEEVERIIGAPFEAVTLERRSGSILATVLLDLCAALGLDELYADVYNNIYAVKIYPQVLRLAEGRDEYIRTGRSNRLDPHVDFAEELGGADPVAPHHRDAAGRTLTEGGRTWDLLAISSALRDRHFVRALNTSTFGILGRFED